MKIKSILLAATATLTLTAQSTDVPNFLKKLEFGVFGGFSGYSLRNNKNKPTGMELEEGGLGGLRIGGAITPHFSLEGAYSYGVNNLNLFPLAGNPALVPFQSGFGARNHSLSLNPVWYFGEADRKLRPYVTAGGGGMWFNPTDKAKARSSQLGQTNTLRSTGEGSFNFGGGVKYGLNKMTSLRLDARNVWVGNPHFGILDVPKGPGSYYISPKGWQTGLQLTAGLGFSLADTKPPVFNTNLTGDTSPMTFGDTRPRPFTLNIDAPAKKVVTTKWSLNSAPLTQSGTVYNFDGTGRPVGPYKICAVSTVNIKKMDPSTSCQELQIVPAPIQTVSVTADPRSVFVGKSSKATVTSDVPASATSTYSWTVNGQKIPGASSSIVFDSTGKAPGNYEICSTVAAPNYTAKSSCTRVEVKALGNPSVSLRPTSQEIEAGQTAKLTATATPNAAGTPVSVAYKASEGTISPDGTFDSSNVTFDKTTPGIQRKNITITATATDELGATATSNATVTVRSLPLAEKLDDLFFAPRSSRVNNCDKRILLEVLAAKLKSDPNSQVILIGHMDASEEVRATRNRKVTQPDHSRALNAAAVLTAGTGICPSMDLSRVKVGYAGTDNSTPAKLDFCGTSTVVKGGKPDPKIEYRRVEIWFVPGGAKMPSTIALEDLPADTVKALGCPK